MNDETTIFSLKIRKLPAGGFVLCAESGEDLQAFGDFTQLWDKVTSEAKGALITPDPSEVARRFAPRPHAPDAYVEIPAPPAADQNRGLLHRFTGTRRGNG